MGRGRPTSPMSSSRCWAPTTFSTARLPRRPSTPLTSSSPRSEQPDPTPPWCCPPSPTCSTTTSPPSTTSSRPKRRSWATPTAPVVVSDPSPGWSAAADTCDSTHPSAAGEVKIAAAQADAWRASASVRRPRCRSLSRHPDRAGRRSCPLCPATAAYRSPGTYLPAGRRSSSRLATSPRGRSGTSFPLPSVARRGCRTA